MIGPCMEDENPRHPNVMDLLLKNGPIIEEKIIKRDSFQYFAEENEKSLYSNSTITYRSKYIVPSECNFKF
jgi:hypothetical protein